VDLECVADLLVLIIVTIFTSALAWPSGARARAVVVCTTARARIPVDSLSLSRRHDNNYKGNQESTRRGIERVFIRRLTSRPTLDATINWV
jgi:hypothetical protein